MPRLATQLTVAIAAQVTLLGLLPQAETRAASFRLEEATVDSINNAFDSGKLTADRPSGLVPPLPSEPAPEPGTTAATLVGMGLGFKLKQRKFKRRESERVSWNA